MIRLTPDWTKAHRLILPLLIALAIGVGVAANTEERSTAIALCGILLLTAVASLAVEPSIGASIGVGGAALIVVVKRTTDAWSSQDFWPTTVVIFACLALGLVAGPVGARLSASNDIGAGVKSGVGQSAGALGLLGAGLGELRLEEEIERATFFGRPVSVLRFRVDLRPGSTGDDERAALLFRSVGRQVESMVRLTDIPFTYDQQDIVVILPETDNEGALIAARRLRAELVASSFGVRPFGHRIRLADHVEIRVAIGCSAVAGNGALELLTAMQTLVADWPVTDADDPEEWIGALAGPADSALYEWFSADPIHAEASTGERERNARVGDERFEVEPLVLPVTTEGAAPDAESETSNIVQDEVVSEPESVGDEEVIAEAPVVFAEVPATLDLIAEPAVEPTTIDTIFDSEPSLASSEVVAGTNRASAVVPAIEQEPVAPAVSIPVEPLSPPSATRGDTPQRQEPELTGADVGVMLDRLLSELARRHSPEIVTSGAVSEPVIQTGLIAPSGAPEIYSFEANGSCSDETPGEPVLYEFVHLQPTVPPVTETAPESGVARPHPGDWSVALLLAARALVEQANETIHVSNGHGSSELSTVIDDMIESLWGLTTTDTSEPADPSLRKKRRG